MSSVTNSIRAACTAQATIASPLGPMLLARTATGLAGVWFEGQKHHPGELAAAQRPGDALLKQAAQQLARYFNGNGVNDNSVNGNSANSNGAAFDLPLDLHGTPFQRAVWQALLRIGAGATQSYGGIARAVGSPQAVRAVGAAVGQNPVSVIVPCHRVLGSVGSLTGYAGGVERKLALLQLEGARPGDALRKIAA